MQIDQQLENKDIKLPYFNDIQDDINSSNIGGILLIAKSIGLYHVIADFLDNLAIKKQFTIGFLLNFSDQELEMIRSLRKNEDKLPIRKIDYSIIAKKRSDMYMQGGIFPSSIVTLTFDFLNKKILPLEIVTNLIINSVEEIQTYKDQESWLCTLLKIQNPTANILGISENVQQLKSGQLSNIASFLYVNKIFLWPKFRKEVIQSLKNQEDNTFEVQDFEIKLQKKNQKIQENLMNLAKGIMEDINIKYKNKKGDVFFDSKDIFFSTDNQILDKIYYNKYLYKYVNEEQLFRDILCIRELLSDLVNMDCVDFYKKIQKIYYNSDEGSIWKIAQMHQNINDLVQNIFKYSKQRIYTVKKIKSDEQVKQKSKEKQKLEQNQPKQNIKQQQQIKQEQNYSNQKQNQSNSEDDNNKNLQSNFQNNINLTNDEKEVIQDNKNITNTVKLKVENINDKYFCLVKPVKIEENINKNIKLEEEDDEQDLENSQKIIKDQKSQKSSQEIQSQKQTPNQNLDSLKNQKEIEFQIDYQLDIQIEIPSKLQALKKILDDLKLEDETSQLQQNNNLDSNFNENENQEKKNENPNKKKIWIYTKQGYQKVFEIKRFIQNGFCKNDKDNQFYMYEQLKKLIFTRDLKEQRQKFINSFLCKKLNNFNEKESEYMLLEQLSMELQVLFDQYIEFQTENIIQESIITGEYFNDEEEKQIQLQQQILEQQVLFESFSKYKKGQEIKENIKEDFKRKKFIINENIKKCFKHLNVEDLEIDVIDELDEAGRVIFIKEKILNNFEIRVNSIKQSANRQHFIRDYQPNYVILFEPFFELQRELELLQFESGQQIKKIYILMLAKSLESQIYYQQVQNEINSFQYLVKEVFNLPNRIQDPNEKIIDQNANLKQVSTRQGGFQNILKPKIIVDTREFRSQIPSYIFHEGFEIYPMMLKRGDIILSNEIGIERKAVETADFRTSVMSGRLDEQLKKLSETFKKPYLLIEWGENQPFEMSSVFQTNHTKRNNFNKKINQEIQQQNGKDQSFRFVTQNISIYLKKYPKIKVLWSKGPLHTIKLLTGLKKTQTQEPNIQQIQEKIALSETTDLKGQKQISNYFTELGQSNLENEKEIKKGKSKINILNQDQDINQNDDILINDENKNNNNKNQSGKKSIIKNNFNFSD